MPIYERRLVTLSTLALLKMQTLPLHAIIVVGSSAYDAETAAIADVVYTEHRNRPLSNKFQHCVNVARQYDPDALFITGSDSWATSTMCEVFADHMAKGADLVGKIHSYSCKANPGEKLEILGHKYKTRKDPIGGGRLFSRKALDLLDWQLYRSGLEQTLDSHSYKKLMQGVSDTKVVIVDDHPEAFSMDIKSSTWPNIDTFDMIKNSGGSLLIKNVTKPEKWIEEKFPGSLGILKSVVPGVVIETNIKPGGIDMDIKKKPYKAVYDGVDLVHPTTVFGKNVKLGHGVIIEEGCEIGDNTYIGNYTVLRPKTKIGKDCVIGHLTVFEGDSVIEDRVLIHAQCHITKGVLIEEDVFIAPFFCGANTRRIKHGRKYELKIIPYIIRRAVRIGIGVLVLPGVVIGENAQIGVGSIVTKHVPPREIWLGSPAEKYKNVPKSEIL